MFFQQLFEKMTENADLHISVKKKDGQMTVAVFFSSDNKEKEETAKKVKNLRPISLAGLPAEIDGAFMDNIEKPLEGINKIFINTTETASDIEKLTEEDKKETERKAGTVKKSSGKTSSKKPDVKAPVKKEDPKLKEKMTKEKVNEFLAKGDTFFENKNYTEALKFYMDAKDLDSKDKRIDAAIKKTEKWIESMKQADLFPQEGENVPDTNQNVIKLEELEPEMDTVGNGPGNA